MRAIKIFTVILLMSASVSLYGAQPVERLEYGGLVHNAIGDAQLELVEGDLVVSNIGEGGFDGVQIELESLREFSAAWSNFSTANLPVFASVQFGTRLTMADENSSTRFSFIILQGLFLERDNLRLLEIAPNLTQTAGAEHRFEVYSNGTPVAAATSNAERIVARIISNTNVPFPTGVRLVADASGTPGYALEWKNLNDVVQIIFPFRDGPPMNANEVRIFPGGAGTPVQSFNELNIWLSEIPELRITDEEAVQ